MVEVGTRRAVDRRRGRERRLIVIGNWKHGHPSNEQSNHHTLASNYGADGHCVQSSYNLATGNNYEFLPTN